MVQLYDLLGHAKDRNTYEPDRLLSDLFSPLMSDAKVGSS